MTKVNAYYSGKTVLTDLTEEEVSMLIHEGLIHVTKAGHHLIQEKEGYNHLFSEKTPLYKKLKYFERFNEVRFTCEDCGKQPSLHIRPGISEDGTVNFKEIVCVCKQCRENKLKKKGILIPQFKKNFSKAALNRMIKTELMMHHTERDARILLADEKFMGLKRAERVTHSVTKIPLPPIRERKDYQRQVDAFLQKIGSSSVDHEINLKDPVQRRALREFLHQEASGLCPCCAKKIDVSDVTIDHIRPSSKGGRDTLSNFIGLCKPCNTEKRNLPVSRYLLEREFLALPPRLLKIAYVEQEEAVLKLESLRKSIRHRKRNLLYREPKKTTVELQPT